MAISACEDNFTQFQSSANSSAESSVMLRAGKSEIMKKNQVLTIYVDCLSADTQKLDTIPLNLKSSKFI